MEYSNGLSLEALVRQSTRVQSHACRVYIAVSREMIGKLYHKNISNKSQVTGQIIILTQSLLLIRTSFQQEIVDCALETINCFIDKKARRIVDGPNQFLIAP
jgi:hypothetical protein